jgi:hypothetical protein
LFNIISKLVFPCFVMITLDRTSLNTQHFLLLFSLAVLILYTRPQQDYCFCKHLLSGL